MCHAQGPTWNPGICPDWELNLGHFALQDDAQPTETLWSGLPLLLFSSFGISVMCMLISLTVFYRLLRICSFLFLFFFCYSNWISAICLQVFGFFSYGSYLLLSVYNAFFISVIILSTPKYLKNNFSLLIFYLVKLFLYFHLDF